MKLNLKKINYHKWIPSRFSSFQAKLLIAFLVATLLPLTLVALVSYHVSYNLARDRITNSALMSDEQLIFQLNSRLNQTENVADTIQYQMYAFEHSSPDQVGTMQALTSMRSNISLYKSTFDFFHIYVFLKPEQTGADEGIYFFSTDKLFKIPPYPELYLLPKEAQIHCCVFVLFRTNPAMFSNMLIVLHLTAMNFPGIFRLLLLIPQFPVTF